jgi:hypothetical protein
LSSPRIVPLLAVLGLTAFAHDIVPRDPPEGSWSIDIHYRLKGPDGRSTAYRGTVSSDRLFRHVAESGSAKKLPLQPPRLRCAKEQALSIYASVARAFNDLTLQPNPGAGARPEGPAYRLTSLSIMLGNQKLSLDTQQPAPPSIVAVIEKFREVSKSTERE